jgi:putative membrane protein insertion efficiency factor
MIKILFYKFLIIIIIIIITIINNTNGCLKCYNNNNNNNINIKLINSIKWYKSTLSPIMPKNCRFLPTCSSYGIEAIEKYGSTKGLILTAWRIIRCNPTGGYGYDPVIWPPVNYFYPLNIIKKD